MNKELTLEQQAFAEKNHNLIYTYLNLKRLSEDEFYDIVIFGYLHSIKKYFNRPELQKYKFSTISFRAMDTSVSNYYRAQNAKMRKGQALSLDKPLLESGTLTLGDITADYKSDVYSEICVNQLFDSLSARERKLISLRKYGYTNSEIAKLFSVKKVDISNSFDTMYQTVNELMAA